jgi:Rieske Fe-S protein
VNLSGEKHDPDDTNSNAEAESRPGNPTGVQPEPSATRRNFFATCGNFAMAGGLAAGYGTLGYCALRFLTPDLEDPNLDWQFVATLASLEGVNSHEYTASSGVKIVIARAVGTAESGFLALSSVCPHLGCQVFWESAKDRFFCPCHNGVFDASGKATAGPPADANQSLTQYPTKILNEALYVFAPLKTVTSTRGGA